MESSPNAALGAPFQLGIVVRDIEAAMQHWLTTMNVGPFTFIEDVGPIKFTYHGKPTDVKIHAAFSYSGDMQIELIQQLNDAPSPYLDFLARGREGVQHLAFYAHDFDAACRHLERSMKHVYTIEREASDERIHYYEGDQQSNMLEIVAARPFRLRYHATLQAQSRGWEGARPIRRYKSFVQFYETFGIL